MLVSLFIILHYDYIHTNKLKSIEKFSYFNQIYSNFLKKENRNSLENVDIKMFSNSPRNIYIKLGLEKSLKESQLKK